MQGARNAWVTLISRVEYLSGVLVLNRSLTRHGSRYPLVVMVTPEISSEVAGPLARAGCVVRPTHHVSVPDRLRAHYARGEFAESWAKLSAFRLVEYDKVVLLDADMLITQNMDELFDTPLGSPHEIAAVPTCVCNPQKVDTYPVEWVPENCFYAHPEMDDRRRRGYFNAGLIVLRPDVPTLNALTDRLINLPSGQRLTFAEQDLLNEHFADSWIPLSYRYNALKTLMLSHPGLWDMAEIKNIHYIIEKPWDLPESPSGQSWGPYRDIYRLWWDAAAEEAELPVFNR